MSLCPNDGKQCCCQPDAGVFCPDSKEIAKYQAMMAGFYAKKDAEIDRLRAELAEAKAELAKVQQSGDSGAVMCSNCGYRNHYGQCVGSPAPQAASVPFAWAREWGGDVSDLDKYVVVFSADEKDSEPDWFALYTKPQQAVSVPETELEVRLTIGRLTVAKRIPLLQAFTSNVNEPSRYADQCWRELSAALAATPEPKQ